MRRAIKVMVMGAFLCALLTVVKASNVFGEAYWEASPHFQYNIVNAVVGLDGAGKRVATIDFSVTDPTNGYVWNIKTDYPFTQTPASRLAIDIGWSTADYQNTGASGLLPLPFGSGAAAATPISVNALRSSVPIGGNVFRVVAALPDQAQGTGVAAMEGHPAWPVDVNGVVTYMN
ncbi:MAG TPA: hypothetical protein VN328_12840, partial [Thermodesulfovibrionales bacterium]|nr:hypothetical protein [Thermodesulfovibrionales bacterium]